MKKVTSAGSDAVTMPLPSATMPPLMVVVGLVVP
eukprot:CAMPEP_0170954522 /NCGR_PEP_ID=MMETSP0735-20130129/32590_1 /TAXON_ID=186038 /ORGANISM="Fragilariopsis kerguelensis, Strain L26-C5" /LENGTH=33 /DNA_ID= /DNA_START= /DNA_END= /DNA_ORIENTATION=